MGKARDNAILAAVVVLVGGGVAAVGFYQDEVTAFIKLQAWNLGPLEAANRKLLDAGAKGDSATLESLLAKNVPGLQPERKNGKIIGFKVPAYGGPQLKRLKELMPKPNPEVTKPKVVALNGGFAKIEATYPGAHMLQLSWDRTPEGWKLTDVGYVGR